MSLKAKRHQWSLQKSNFQDNLQNIGESNQTLSSWHFIQLTEQRFPMKQLFVRKYKQDFQQRVSPFLIENRELQDKITEMKSWEGNNYYYLIETRHILQNDNLSSLLDLKFVLTSVWGESQSYYHFASVLYSIKKMPK